MGGHPRVAADLRDRGLLGDCGWTLWRAAQRGKRNCFGLFYPHQCQRRGGSHKGNQSRTSPHLVVYGQWRDPTAHSALKEGASVVKISFCLVAMGPVT
jgi:hypothetical protein